VTLLVTYQFACDAGDCNRATEEIFARGPVSAWRVAQRDGWTGQRRHYCPWHAEVDAAPLPSAPLAEGRHGTS
jgi:hypothetical protein